MRAGDALRKNIEFWHWYPRLLCEDLTEEQLHWQPETHSNHIIFTIWHAYRSEDEIIHGLLIRQPSVFARDGWAARLPVAEPGTPPIGTGLSRQQIAAIRLDLETLLSYGDAVKGAVQAYADSLSDEEAAGRVALPPVFTQTYPVAESMTTLDGLTFFSIGHTVEHLGEVQYIKGLMGLKGAPL